MGIKGIVILLNCFIVALLISTITNIRPIFASTNVFIINNPNEIINNSEFDITFTINKEPSNITNYYVKARIGISPSSMNQGETFNPTSNSWLSDTSNWNEFPIITLDSNGVATSTAKLRTKSTATGGINLLSIRVREINGSINYDSSSVNISVLEPSPTPTLPTPSPTHISEISPSPIPTEIITPTLTPTLTISTPTIVPTQLPISYNNIYLSEVMVYPDGDNEWIEIYNDNDFTVSLQNWYIDDIENGGSSPKIFSLDISPKSYAVFNLASSMFNNNGDSVRLMDFNKNLKDSFEYSSSTKGKTLGRLSFDSDNFCIQEPTKKSANNNCIITPTQTPDPTNTPKPTTPAKEKTPTPTKIVITSENISSKNTRYDEIVLTNEEPISGSDLTEESPVKVLGVSTKQESYASNSKPILQSLTFASFSYSLLTIISILMRLIKLPYSTHYKLPTTH